MTDVAMPGRFRLAGTFGRTVAIYGRRFVPFIVLTMIASVPGLILSVALTGGAHPPSSGAGIGAAFLNATAALLASCAVMYCVVEELGGRASSVAGSIRFLARRLLPLLGVALCTASAMASGVLMLPLWSHVAPALPGALGHLLPGAGSAALVNTVGLVLGVVVLLLPWCMFCLSMPVCIAESAGVLASMSRSRRLTRGHRFRVFGTLLLFTLGVLTLHSAFAGVALAGVLAAAGEIGVVVANAALGAIDTSVYGVLAGVLYHDLRREWRSVDARFARVFD